MADFFYQDPYPILADSTTYRKVTSDFVRVDKVGDREIISIDPKGLELLAQEALSDVSFYLRASHLEKLRAILDDPEATDNDRFVAYNLLQNATIAAEGQLPSCQDTGTAIVIGKKVKMYSPVSTTRNTCQKGFLIRTKKKTYAFRKSCH